MPGRTYTVEPPHRAPSVYNGFNRNPIGAWYELQIGEEKFYSEERDLALAICEVARYGQEQYGWAPPVGVTPLPPALVSQTW